MTHPGYFVTFDAHRDKSLVQFGELLKRLPKKPVGTVQLAELCSMPDYAHGLYFFFSEDGELRYVGKSTSRSFIERIPSHFDQRHEAWFNTLPKRIASMSQDGDYASAHALGLSLHLALLGLENKATAIKLEGALRSFLQPTLNAGKKGRFVGTELLSSYET